MIPRMSGNAGSAEHVDRQATYDSIWEETSTRDEVKRIVDCHRVLVVVWNQQHLDGVLTLGSRSIPTRPEPTAGGWWRSGSEHRHAVSLFFNRPQNVAHFHFILIDDCIELSVILLRGRQAGTHN